MRDFENKITKFVKQNRIIRENVSNENRRIRKREEKTNHENQLKQRQNLNNKNRMNILRKHQNQVDMICGCFELDQILSMPEKKLPAQERRKQHQIANNIRTITKFGKH